MKILITALVALLSLNSFGHQLETNFYEFDFKKFFEANGVNFPPGAKIKYVQAAGRLVVTADQKDHDKIAIILGHQVKKKDDINKADKAVKKRLKASSKTLRQMMF